MTSRRTLTSLGRLMTVAAISVGWACSSEHVTSVGVTSVTVNPSSLNAIVGERHELSAIVIDDQGSPLEDAAVAWSSSDEALAVVDETGMVDARAPGEVEIRATFRDARGTATVRVLPQPSIGVSRDSVAMTTGSTGADPPPEVVHVTNEGVGSLGGLSVEVRYPEGTRSTWLTAELGSTRTPTTLTLTADAQLLALGTYRALVLLESEDVDDPPIEIVVTLTVRLI